jgi:hypothetical protein
MWPEPFVILLELYVLSDVEHCTVKKRIAIFPSPAGMSLTNLSLAGGDGKISNLFYSVDAFEFHSSTEL